jgi:catechol 2,3-dioxygenase-like lactoylglutathione lyase family enzyme
MNILGVDQVVLGVEEMDGPQRFLRDFGLTQAEFGATGATFEALDGTNLVLRHASDRGLPMAVGPTTNAREIVWGVGDAQELNSVAAELSKDRQVSRGPDGVLRTRDDTGYAVAFRVSTRHAFTARPVVVNAPGQAPQRGPNKRIDFAAPHQPRSLGHIVLFVPDLERARDFYINRLGFRLTDSYRERSCFLRAQGSHDHHNLFLIKKEDVAGGLHHIEFHVGDFNEVMMGGRRLTEKGWKTFVGPGRHILGSNYFWYFNTPCGGNLELACDMDYVTDEWEPGEWDYSNDVIAAWCTSYTRYGH